MLFSARNVQYEFFSFKYLVNRIRVPREFLDVFIFKSELSAMVISEASSHP
jgi:hypothetical protein